MNHRLATFLGIAALVALVVVILLAPAPANAQAQKASSPAAPKGAASTKPWTAPRTPDGQPDLQGYWTNNSYTPLERPNGVTKEFYTPAELEEANKKAAEREEEQTLPGTVADVHYD